MQTQGRGAAAVGGLHGALIKQDRDTGHNEQRSVQHGYVAPAMLKHDIRHAMLFLPRPCRVESQKEGGGQGGSERGSSRFLLCAVIIIMSGISCLNCILAPRALKII